MGYSNLTLSLTGEHCSPRRTPAVMFASGEYMSARGECYPPRILFAANSGDKCSPAANAVRREHRRTMFAANTMANIGEHLFAADVRQCSRRTIVRRKLADLFACSPRVRRESARIRRCSPANVGGFARIFFWRTPPRTRAGSRGFAANTGEQMFAADSAIYPRATVRREHRFANCVRNE